LSLVLFFSWRLPILGKKFLRAGNGLFIFAIIALLASSGFLYARGLVTNSGAPGYGATKYLIIVICSSLPILWLMVITHRRIQGYVKPTLSATLI
jgi:hypothetical protein